MGKQRLATCVVCLERPIEGSPLCGPCGRSHDRDRDGPLNDGSLAFLIRWAAKRARAYERARWVEREERKP